MHTVLKMSKCAVHLLDSCFFLLFIRTIIYLVELTKKLKFGSSSIKFLVNKFDKKMNKLERNQVGSAQVVTPLLPS